MEPKQPWCAKLQYPGLLPFLFGTVWVRDGRQEEATTAIRELWATRFPHPMPPIVAMMPGALVFQGQEE